MEQFLSAIPATLVQGLVYALVSLGVYITYSILDFPDLGVDGTFALGAAVTAILLTRGISPWLTLPVSLAVGALAGLFTGVLHVRLGIRDLLAGIITMTGLYSLNLQIAGSNLTIDRGTDTLFTAPPAGLLLSGLSLTGRKIAVSLLLVLAVKLLMDAYLRTKSGLLLRAVGDNASLVTTLARDRGRMKILGLVLSNALVALAGCIVCHEGRSFSATMGTGQLVFGLAAVIIGISLTRAFSARMERFGPCRRGLLRALTHPVGTTAVILGSILYKLCIQAAMSVGVPANMMKLVTALLFLLVLVLSGRKGEEIIRA